MKAGQPYLDAMAMPVTRRRRIIDRLRRALLEESGKREASTITPED